jgi:hypothetical protein
MQNGVTKFAIDVIVCAASITGFTGCVLNRKRKSIQEQQQLLHAGIGQRVNLMTKSERAVMSARVVASVSLKWLEATGVMSAL